MAEHQVEAKFGFTTEEMKELSDQKLLDKMVEAQDLWGINCAISDTCTGVKGTNLCQLPPGEKAEKELEVGWIIAPDKNTEDPSGNWGACARELYCPLVYDTPKVAVLRQITTKTFEEQKCVGTVEDNLC